jgi:hypothetical protein
MPVQIAEARPRTEAAIMGSTGGLGVSRREPGRLYINAKIPVTGGNIDGLRKTIDQAQRITAKMGPDSRAVIRTVVDGDAARLLLAEDNTLRPHIEYAVPLNDHTTSGEQWLIGFGHNNVDRRGQVSRETVLTNTSPENYRKQPKTALERVENVLDKGYTITSEITEEMIPQLLNLWKDTFGWEHQEVVNLAAKLKTQKDIDPQNKKVWFTGIMDNGQLVAASMAERLDLPAGDDMLTLVESTEWKSRTDKEGQGLLAAAAATTHAQVLFDLDGLKPFIYAECNYQTRADFAAHGIGMEIPRRSLSTAPDFLVPQSLMQNVFVEGERSDFTYWHLSPRGRETYYSEDDVATIVGKIAA